MSGSRIGRLVRQLLPLALFCIGAPGPAAPAPANDYHFAILGDRTGEAQPGVYEQVWREVDQFHPDFVINVGDVIQGGDDAAAAREWQSVRDLWRKYKYPLYFTPGNHDIWSAASEKLYTQYTGHPPFYSFNYQDTHFTILDNSRTSNLSDEQMRFLEQDLDRNRSAAVKFVFFHQPQVWLIPLKFQSEFELHKLLLNHHVTMVVSGHTHQFSRLEKDGIVYLCVGSSGGHLRGSGFDNGWFFHHVRAAVHGSQVTLTVKEMDSPGHKGRIFAVSDWSDNAPAKRPPAVAQAR